MGPHPAQRSLTFTVLAGYHKYDIQKVVVDGFGLAWVFRKRKATAASGQAQSRLSGQAAPRARTSTNLEPGIQGRLQCTRHGELAFPAILETEWHTNRVDTGRKNIKGGPLFLSFPPNLNATQSTLCTQLIHSRVAAVRRADTRIQSTTRPSPSAFPYSISSLPLMIPL